ncbi:MAG: recombinase family protein [Phycisphaerae bacterium]|nr:recombinase family protein [Phycisphaerae bacterium]
MPTSNSIGLRAAIYARVSSDQQAQCGTIASQVAALDQRVAADGLVLEAEQRFIDDGYTGSTLLRPAMERLRDQAAAGAIDRLYVHSPDRLARRYAYQVLLVDEFQQCGVELVFLNRALSQGPEDELLLQVQGVVAEYERAKIMERSRRGKLHAARSGKVNVLAHAPYGYRYLPKALAGGQATMNVHLEEARVVQEMFRWVGVERLSISQVARKLKDRGIASPRGRSYWDRGTVWGILRNPTYKGQAAFGKRKIVERQVRLRPYRQQPEQPRRPVSYIRTPAEDWISIPVPAIIDADLFDAVGRQLQENKQRHRLAKQTPRYLLQGLVVCGQCEFALCGRRVRNRWYYRCVGNVARRMTGQKVCGNHSVRGDLLEEAVWNDVKALLADPQRVWEEYQRRLAPGTGQQAGSKPRDPQAMVRHVQRQIGRLIDAYSEGLIGKEDFEPRVRGARQRLAQLQAAAESLARQEDQQRQMRLVIGQLEAFSQQVSAGLKEADWAMRRDLIRTLVKRIEVGPEEVRVVYRVGVGPFALAPRRGQAQDCWRRPRRALSSAQVPSMIRGHAGRIQADAVADAVADAAVVPVGVGAG